MGIGMRPSKRLALYMAKIRWNSTRRNFVSNWLIILLHKPQPMGKTCNQGGWGERDSQIILP
jgi:hypothetical protein